MNDISSAHRQAWDLIPWIVNGSAPETERQAVQAHLEACADCRQELEFQRQLQAAMAVQSTAELDMRDSWQRLRSRLDTAAQPDAAVRSGHRRARGIGNAWTPWLVAAMVVQAIGLGALGTAWWSRPTTPSRPASRPISSTTTPTRQLPFTPRRIQRSGPAFRPTCRLFRLCP